MGIWFGAILDLPCGLAVLVMGIMFSFDQVCYSLLVTNLVLACLFDLEDFLVMDIACLFDPVCCSLLVINPVLDCLSDLEEFLVLPHQRMGNVLHKILG